MREQRRIAYGYRFHSVLDQCKSQFGEVANDFKVVRQDPQHSESRPKMVSLGCQYEGYCPPHPDDDPQSVVAGLARRIARKPPAVSRKIRRSIQRFVRLWCKRNLNPIKAGEDLSVERWLAQAPYTERRKVELRRCYDELTNYYHEYGHEHNIPDSWLHTVKCFTKSETYDKYKPLRGIYSRNDYMKLVFGPLFWLISEEVFHYPGQDNEGINPFIKTVPVPERPMVLADLLIKPGTEYLVSDYTSFESHFVVEMMKCIEMELYKYMLQHIENKCLYLNLIKKCLMGENVLQFRNVVATITARRMSGEMNTSLGNGFTNYMVMKYLVWTKNGTCKGVVEGDDGLFVIEPKAAIPTVKDYADLGFTAKVETFVEPSDASFCGMIFDPDNRVVVSDPRPVLCSTGWSNNRYITSSKQTLDALLRAKGYSLCYEYAGNPILQEFGKWILRHTKHVTQKRLNTAIDMQSVWYREQMLMAIKNPIPDKPVHMNTRMLVSRLFDISVDKQLEIENWFKNSQCIEPLNFNIDLPKSWKHYWDNYTTVFRDDGCLYGSGDISIEFEKASKYLSSIITEN